jgi:hypothetical protein
MSGGKEGWGDGRRERRRQTFGSSVVNRDTARCYLRALLSVRDVAEDDVAGQAISGLEGCHICFYVPLSSSVVFVGSIELFCDSRSQR